MKEHKVIVTRDKDNRENVVDLWEINNSTQYLQDGWWLGSKHIRSYYSAKQFKTIFGFTPRKGSKEVITIRREKK